MHCAQTRQNGQDDKRPVRGRDFVQAIKMLSRSIKQRSKKMWVKFALEFFVDDLEIYVDDREALAPNRQNS
jgi:hypothetical protein